MVRLTERIKGTNGECVVYTKGRYEETLAAEMEVEDVRTVLQWLADYEDAAEAAQTAPKGNLRIADFIQAVGENAERHGFHEVNTKPTDYVALIHSEVSEVLEEFRAGHGATQTYYRESDGKPEGVPMELADVVIRCFDMAAYYGIDLETAIIEKQLFNEKRPYMHGKEF